MRFAAVLLCCAFAVLLAPLCWGEVTFGDCGVQLLNCPQCLSCCNVSPSCQTSTHVTCGRRNCPVNAITLHSQSQHPETAEVRVSHARTVTLYINNQIASTPEVTLENIDTVRIMGLQPLRRQRTAMTSLTIRNVTSLTIEANAFGTWANKFSSVVIDQVGKCVIEGDAFPRQSVIGNVLLMNIDSLEAKENAFSAKIGSLSLRHVTTKTCRHKTFGGQISDMAILSSKLGNVHHSCVFAAPKWIRLAIRSSTIARVDSYGFTGSIDDVQIQDSTIGFVDRSGLILSVTRFMVRTSKIQVLSPHAFHVQADDSISIQSTNITRLKKNALSKLSFRSGIRRALSLNGLRIGSAEVQSLALADSVTAESLTGLLFLEPCECPLNQRARSLIYGVSSNQTRESNTMHITNLLENSRCKSADNSTHTLMEYGCRHCGRTCSRASWVPYVATAAAALLLLSVAAVFLLFKRDLILSTLKRRKSSLEGYSAAPENVAQNMVERDGTSCTRPSFDSDLDLSDEMKRAARPVTVASVGESSEAGYAAIQPDLLSSIPTKPKTQCKLTSSPLYDDAAYSPGAAAGQDPVYSTVPHEMDARGDMELYEEVLVKNPPPVYAQVSKKLLPSAGKLPGALYANVFKKKKPDEREEKSDKLPIYAQVLKTKKGDTPPVYAQVLRKKLRGEAKPSTIISPTAFSSQVMKKKSADDQGWNTSVPPVYAQVCKKK